MANKIIMFFLMPKRTLYKKKLKNTTKWIVATSYLFKEIMDNITRKQHFVPQFYLRQFIDTDNFLHCYRKTNGKRFPAHTDDICFREYGYEVNASFGNSKFLLPNEIEKMFRSLENEYNQVLKSILQKCILNPNGHSLICTPHEKEVLASMVSNFLVRNFLAVEEHIDNEITQDLLLNNEEVRDIDHLLREMRLGDAKPLLELAQKKSFLDPSQDGTAKFISNALLGMNVSFFVADSINFITSDCPVGYDCNSEELFMARMPLSTRVMVVYTQSKTSRFFRNKACLIKPCFVEKFNRDYLNWDVPQMLIAHSQKDITTLIGDTDCTFYQRR